jgi:hypothetical protein
LGFKSYQSKGGEKNASQEKSILQVREVRIQIQQAGKMLWIADEEDDEVGYK